MKSQTTVNLPKESEAEGPYTVGIDAGSKTIKIVIFDGEGKRIYDSYNRHQSNIKKTLQDNLRDVIWRKGDIQASVVVTGSAGIEVARILDIPFIQEVVAVTDAVKEMNPEADAVIELGGEDSKIIYLTGGLEQRMNSTCAGGTGGFIDSIAYMLGVRPAMMERLAYGARRTYPIASRCAVFAQTDVRPLLNAGASKNDIAASVHDAMVRQTLGGLACGRPIRGNVVFLGGPFEFNAELVSRFRQALNLDTRGGVKPRDAHLYTATGAAIAARDEGTPRRFSELLERLEVTDFDDASEILHRLPPLFESDEERERFIERHRGPSFPRAAAMNAEGPLYLGIDAGSTTSKIALINEEGAIVHSDYRENEGDTVETVRQMLIDMYRALPRADRQRRDLPYVAGACATGYGETLLRAGFGIDSGVVETMAHARAAQEICPGVTFMLDIGGQDMKALWLEDGKVKDAVLNEACSSGCGSFVSGTAHSVKTSKDRFATLALTAERPVDLGTKCTVFMSSRVKHAQKAGAGVEDIAAGVAYSVIQNALQRIIGPEKAEKLGDRIVVAGGTFKSDAILRAFELISGQEVIRPREAHLMGAIGSALIARERAHAQGGKPVSSILNCDQLEALEVKRVSATCEGCQNSCALSVLSFGDGRSYVGGNKCERGRILYETVNDTGSASTTMQDNGNESADSKLPPNTFEVERKVLGAFGDTSGAESGISIGLLGALDQYENLPFWHKLFTGCGFDVVVPKAGCEHESDHSAWESIPAESMCFPAKLVHSRAFSLREKGCKHIFATSFERGAHCPVASGYGDVLADSVEFIRDGSVRLLSPRLSSSSPERIVADAGDREALFEALAELRVESGGTLEQTVFLQALDGALEEQRRFEAEAQRAGDEALAWIDDAEGRQGVVLVGRPYLGDEALMNDIDGLLRGLGFAVLSPLSLKGRIQEHRRLSDRKSAFKPAKHIYSTADYIASDPRLQMVCLQFFGCGFDAVSVEEAKALIENAGKPFTALKLDEMVDISHIRIRLRTLADMLEQGAADFGGEVVPEKTSGEAASADPSADGEGTSDSDRAEVFRPMDEPMDDDDLFAVRALSAKDACFAVRAMAAKTSLDLEARPDAAAVELPKVCEQCLMDAIPLMVEDSCGRTPEYTWSDGLPETLRDLGGNTPYTVADSSDRPSIGILGNALMVFDRGMNENLAKKLEDLGCQPVFPDPDDLIGEDVAFEKALARFQEAGVQDVIYAQSFGCLKANSQVRGQINRLKEKFPSVNLTVLDYDPESSELNRENRIRLMVEAARDHEPVSSATPSS